MLIGISGSYHFRRTLITSSFEAIKCSFGCSYADGGILTFRLRRKRLSTREAPSEGVPPTHPFFPALPAQVHDFVSHPGREVDEAPVKILDLATEGEDLIDVRLDGPVQVGPFADIQSVGVAVDHQCLADASPVVGLVVVRQFAKFPHPGELRVESEENLLE